MDLQQIRYVVALAKEGSFQRAARSVGISQPTLSQQVKKLEDELGSPLFERSSHAVRLTVAGEKFIPFAMGALESLSAGSQMVRSEKNALDGLVKLGFIPTVGPYLLPVAIRKLQKQAPNLRLELFEETTSVLVESLKAGKCDLGLLALPVGDSALASRSLGAEEFYLAVSKKHPLASKKQIIASDLSDEPLLMLKEGHCFRDQALDFCRRGNASPQVTFEGSSLVSVMNLVASGDGITLVPKMTVDQTPHAGLKFIPFKDPKPMREIGICWRMTMPLTAVQRFVLDALGEAFKK